MGRKIPSVFPATPDAAISISDLLPLAPFKATILVENREKVAPGGVTALRSKDTTNHCTDEQGHSNHPHHRDAHTSLISCTKAPGCLQDSGSTLIPVLKPLFAAAVSPHQICSSNEAGSRRCQVGWGLHMPPPNLTFRSNLSPMLAHWVCVPMITTNSSHPSVNIYTESPR